MDKLPFQIFLGYNTQDQYDNKYLLHKNGKAYLKSLILGFLCIFYTFRMHKKIVRACRIFVDLSHLWQVLQFNL
jgi:hypothetical protein